MFRFLVHGLTLDADKKQDNPTMVKANEMAELTFQPLQPFVVDTFKSCEGLGRIAIMEVETVVRAFLAPSLSLLSPISSLLTPPPLSI